MRRFAKLRLLLRDKRAVAALEFALILPMMVLMLFGSVELTQAVAANRRVQNTAASLADVVSRDTVVTNAEIADLWTAAKPLMYPNPSTPMKMAITCVHVESASKAVVLWGEASGLTAQKKGDAITLPSGLMVANTYLVMAETQYEYTPPSKMVISVLKLKHTEYKRTRTGAEVKREP
jgi:Flp pilus assembly protein TadG